MEELTSKQRKMLRSLARQRDANIIIGKQGITEAVIKHLSLIHI